MASASIGALIVRPQPVPIIPVSSSERTGGVTVGDLCAAFIQSKMLALESGDLAPKTFRQYKKTLQDFALVIGDETPLADVGVAEFNRFRHWLPKHWGPAAVWHWVGGVRSLFKFAYEAELIDVPVRFGPNFKKASKKMFRAIRQSRGLQMFEAQEIRRLLDVAKPAVRAMILLGVNCGFGNTDCGRLPFSAVDLDGGWVSYPRPKTGIDRRCSLWPETIIAIKRAIELRPEPASASLKGNVFLTTSGECYAPGDAHSPLSRQFLTLFKRASVEHREQRGFYGLRRTFETIGGATKDQVAVDYIMGHTPASGDMAAVYRQRIDDDRLLAVTEHIRWWLSPDKSQFQIDHQKRLQQKAMEIVEVWETIDRLKGSDVKEALTKLRVSQTELAHGIGRGLDWINILIHERDGKKIGSDMDLRFRHFMLQLSEGRTPTPLAKEELRTQFDNPREFPLSDEALAALDHQPLTAADLRVVVDCLKESGVLQATLAKSWGYKFKRLREMLCGNMKIPKRGADRLREIFGLAPKLRSELPPAPAYANNRQLPVSPEVKAIFDSPEFGGPQLRELTTHLRRKHGITQNQLNAWLKPAHKFICSYSYRFTNSPGLRASLRQLFAFKSNGDPQ